MTPTLTAALVTAAPTEIPSPTTGVFHLGPLPIRAYALCILAGIAMAIWMTDRRLQARGHDKGVTLDISVWAVVAGIIGARLYHVVTTPAPYWGKNGTPVKALYIWEGGMGVWGAIALGAVGAWLGCRRAGVRFSTFADAAAPGIPVGQALGRWGNYFNNELHGSRTDLPWGLQIHEWDQAAGRAVTDAHGQPVVLGTFHPMFLYEALFCLLLAVVLLLVDRYRSLAPGQLTGLYIAGYPVGRIVFEKMRTDEAEVILGQRLNVWTSIVVFLLGVGIAVWSGRRARASGAVDEDRRTPAEVSA